MKSILMYLFYLSTCTPPPHYSKIISMCTVIHKFKLLCTFAVLLIQLTFKVKVV